MKYFDFFIVFLEFFIILSNDRMGMWNMKKHLFFRLNHCKSKPHNSFYTRASPSSYEYLLYIIVKNSLNIHICLIWIKSCLTFQIEKYFFLSMWLLFSVQKSFSPLYSQIVGLVQKSILEWYVNKSGLFQIWTASKFRISCV